MAQTKKRLNLTIDRTLADEAKSHGLNLSAVCERAIAAALKKRREAKWLEDNRAAIESVNEHIARNGVFGSEYRKF